MKKSLSFVFLLAILFPVACGQVWDEERVSAFEAIRFAEDAGADVSELINNYNNALALVATGNLENISQAEQIFNDIIEAASVLQVEAVQQGNIDAGIAVAKTLVLVALAVVVWMRGDQWFWRFWRRTKQGYVVE